MFGWVGRGGGGGWIGVAELYHFRFHTVVDLGTESMFDVGPLDQVT